jgi:hypothetical protein
MPRKRELPSPDQPVLVARDAYAVSPPGRVSSPDRTGRLTSGHLFRYRPYLLCAGNATHSLLLAPSPQS